ncbi:PAQR family membrane homeostasis protein TrhA [Arenicella xantha]|uniref:Hemolysin III n=1 Tax=Arenicella xantha TaxID=644221 RepID=A0A395JQT5_9GAMM|nr:hemolysin III family protein [Arenicella xantha]RBP52816.1 hemolysin III [Arenicella xantha]
MYKGERFNSISHLVGAALALVGASVLITLAAVDGNALKIVSYSIYSATLFILYLTSTLYHSFQGRVKDIFQKFDHHAIYLLIAGTYTPFALIAVQGAVGWWLFGVVWGLAAIGMIIENLPIPGPRILPIIIYIAMGWACVFTMESMIAGMSELGFYFLLTGGIIYTAGVIFYVLDHWYPWCHGIWHLFVIGGSVCHYFAIFLL